MTSAASSSSLSSDKLLSIHYSLSWECKEQLDQALTHGTGLESMSDNCVGEVRDSIDGKGRSKGGQRAGARTNEGLEGGGRGSKVVGAGGVFVVMLFLAVLVLIMAVVLRGGERGGKGQGVKGGKKGDNERISPSKKGSAKKGKKKGG